MLQSATRPLRSSQGHAIRPCSLSAKSRHRVIVNFKPSSPEQSPPSSNNNSKYVQDTFQKTIDIMLNRAASSLKRGACSCLSCRGGGTLECAHCKGNGRLSSEAADRAGALRGALLRLRTAVGMPPQEVPYASSGWMRTNRCPRCHGVGRLACEPCSGSGLRFPHQQDRNQ